MEDSEDCREVVASTGGDFDNSDILKQILEAKNGEPNRFQSFWEKDEQDVDEFTEEEIKNEPSKRVLWAAENNLLEEMDRLLTFDSGLVHCTDRDGYTPLHRAAYNDHCVMAEKLLMKGADLSARTCDGWQPLHSASRWNCTQTAQLLLHNGADVNAQSCGGLSPLHLACSEHDNLQVAELLLSWPGSRVDLVSQAGQTPVDLAGQSQALDGLFRMAAPCVNELYPGT